MIFIFALCLLTACIPGSDSLFPAGATQETTATPALAEVIFWARVPEQTPASQGVMLEVVDEVTGLAFNAQRHAMEATSETNVFTARLQVPAGSIIKYRYLRAGNPVVHEYTPQGDPVRYRRCVAASSTTVRDIVAAWSNLPFSGPTGRLAGVITEAVTNNPLPDVLVTFGGMQTITAADGSFRIDRLPPGVQTIVVHSLDGKHKPHQQEAVIAPDALTPADIQVEAAMLVNVSFTVSVPAGTSGEMTIRLVGNLYQLGNTFADQEGGMSVLASRAPLMTRLPDGRYHLTLQLPVGTDLRYKYTLGDGFWNSELTSEGRFRERQLIVPARDTHLEENVDTWKSTSGAPILFTATVPPETPAGDKISIQFNPFVWMQPIPMWSTGNRQWRYILYNPLNLPANVAYRFCRNDQCGQADGITSAVSGSSEQHFSVQAVPQTLATQVQRWAAWQAGGEPTTVVAAEINPRSPEFITAVELSPNWNPGWQPYVENGMANIKDSAANTVVLTPSWTYSQQNPPLLEPLAGFDPLWADTLHSAVQARRLGMELVIFPILRDKSDQDVWRGIAERDAAWWTNWFERYQTFALHHARMAALTGARALVLGGPAVDPAIRGASAAGTQEEIDLRWRQIIALVRTQYQGSLYWALALPDVADPIPEFLSQVDGIYLLVSAPIASEEEEAQSSLASNLGRLLDERAAPLRESPGKPIVLALQYSAHPDSAQGCPQGDLDCLLFDASDSRSGEVDLKAQVDVYNAVFVVVNQRDWLNGVVSRGFYPPVALQDSSASIHGKPAWNVVWYWFSRLAPAAAP